VGAIHPLPQAPSWCVVGQLFSLITAHKQQGSEHCVHVKTDKPSNENSSHNDQQHKAVTWADNECLNSSYKPSAQTETVETKP
jgi:hypothetical protein